MLMQLSNNIANCELNCLQFYKELGYLFSDDAYSDIKLRKKEVELFCEFASKDLAFYETSIDSSGLNPELYTQFEFAHIANKY
jgi:hypothetical protein